MGILVLSIERELVTQDDDGFGLFNLAPLESFLVEGTPLDVEESGHIPRPHHDQLGLGVWSIWHHQYAVALACIVIFVLVLLQEV